MCRLCTHPFDCAGLVRPGGTIVEGTAGNTGIGLAHLCNSLGYKCVIFMPNTQSQVSQNMQLIEGKHVSIRRDKLLSDGLAALKSTKTWV